MLRIKTISGETEISMEGSAPDLIIEWMKLTQSLSEKLGEATGVNVTLDKLVSTGMKLLEVRSDD